jgi:C4-type Zn-finger protein
MAHHDKIIANKLDCPLCGGLNMETYVKARWEKSGNLISLNHICHHCGGRVKIVENINGFLVLHKYIPRKDKVKRVKNDD